MSGMKTLLLAATLSTALGGQAIAENDMSWTFAACAGRFSAEMEHSWLIGTPDSEQHESNRATFASLTQAVMTKSTARALLHHRVHVKRVHAQLIQTANFVEDQRRARLAKRMAASHLNACHGLLLGG